MLNKIKDYQIDHISKTATLTSLSATSEEQLFKNKVNQRECSTVVSSMSNDSSNITANENSDTNSRNDITNDNRNKQKEELPHDKRETYALMS